MTASDGNQLLTSSAASVSAGQPTAETHRQPAVYEDDVQVRHVESAAGRTGAAPEMLARTRLLAHAVGCPVNVLLGDQAEACLDAQSVQGMVDELERVTVLLMALLADRDGSEPVQVLQTVFGLLDLPEPEPREEPYPQ